MPAEEVGCSQLGATHRSCSLGGDIIVVYTCLACLVKSRVPSVAAVQRLKQPCVTTSNASAATHPEPLSSCS